MRRQGSWGEEGSEQNVGLNQARPSHRVPEDSTGRCQDAARAANRRPRTEPWDSAGQQHPCPDLPHR
ncbi:hypothetical protein TsFJ059_007252, partial [Trichoderma semiorbis]